MIKPVVLLAVVVLLVFSDRDPFKCVEDGKCPPGSTCINGTCYGRVDCPQVLMPQLKSGCTMTLEPDENDCPMPKIVCDKELQRCGDIYCERGYACNPDTNTCVMRWDCPMFNVDVNDKCTKMVLDDNDCFTPVDICEQSGTIRQKRAAATKRKRCPKNAEYRECTNICPEKSCDNYLQVSSCFSLRCGAPGCICKEGYVFLSSNKELGCVKRETCVKLNALKKSNEKNTTNN